MTAQAAAQLTDAVEDARQLAEQAYAPYSHFHVGCIAETEDGQRFHGVNMENASYGVTICAEAGALSAAAAAGSLHKIKRIFVTGGKIGADGHLYGDAVVPPCGRCRQLILEAATLGGTDIEVICASGDGGKRLDRPISALLPDGFDPSMLA